MKITNESGGDLSYKRTLADAQRSKKAKKQGVNTTSECLSSPNHLYISQYCAAD